MNDLIKSFIGYKLTNHVTRIDLIATFIDIDT